jgi:hypothetical protein
VTISRIDPELRARLDVVVADALGLEDHEPAAPARTVERKLVVFVPEEALDVVRNAAFAAGAGRIGRYERCSAYGEVTGTFRGGEGTSPAVGESGREERVRELRLETIYPLERERDVVEAVVSSHPYEEPAIDLYPLANVRLDRLEGRVGRLAGDPAAALAAVRVEPVFVRRGHCGPRVAVFTAVPGPCDADVVIAPAGDPDVLAPTIEAWALARLER